MRRFSEQAILVAFGLGLGLFSPTATSWEGGDILVPHRHGSIAIDGRLDDWDTASFETTFEDSQTPTPLRNSGTVRLCWDAKRLFVAFEVQDAEVFAPPTDIEGATLYEWDSVELYLDTRADGGPRMRPDDYQLIFSCDGRVALLQGDALIATMASFGVPKSERPAGAIRAAAVRHSWGYIVEAAVPFEALGLAAVEAGARMRVDAAWNDWIGDHAPLPVKELDLSPLEQLARPKPPLEPQPTTPAIPSDEAERDILGRLYLPWAWSETRDFGYPREWRAVRLVGRPALLESFAENLGTRGAILLAALAALAAAGLAFGIARRRYKIRVRDLAARLDVLEVERIEDLAALEDDPPRPEESPREPPSEAPGIEVAPDADDEDRPSTSELTGRIDVIRERETMSGSDARSFAKRVITHVEAHMEEAISVTDLARRLHVSPRTLQRAVKDAAQCSPSELVLAIKMRRAKQLLRDKGLRVGEVAFEVGFENPEHFAKRFKKHYGLPPSQVEKRNGTPQDL